MNLVSIWRPFGEGIALAFDSMRSNKLRSALTTLGVVIGVTTVMVMASLVDGIRQQIFATMENASPSTFYVMRYFSSTPVNPDNLPAEVRIRPVLDEGDVAALMRRDEIRHAGLWVQVQQRMSYQGAGTQAVMIYGADDAFLEANGGTLLRGRFFSNGERGAGSPVVVLEVETADRLFGRIDPMGKVIRIGGRSFTVIGIYQKPENIFQPPGTTDGGVVPYRAAKRSFPYDETNSLFITVLAARGVPVPVATDAAITALRLDRALRPGQPNSFDVVTADQILDIMDSLTSAFFLVMIALSSVALLVGGIGVMAIMMVSVTDRTHEIGLRKAVGATNREVLWQFLVEAATLTGFGGLLGIGVGMAGGALLKQVLSLESGPPIWSAVVAASVSVGIGLVFGMIPALRAARMDPVEALRHE